MGEVVGKVLQSFRRSLHFHGNAAVRQVHDKACQAKLSGKASGVPAEADALHPAVGQHGFPHQAASALLPDGTLVMAGGSDVSPVDDFPAGNNFKNSREVWAFPTEDAPAKATLPWPWFLVIGLLLLTAGALLFRRKKAALVQPEETDVIPAAPLLKEQLSKIIEEEELFKQPDLRVTDIAARLATNRTYVSAIIKSLSGDSFSTLVNGYRVRYAQKLMQEHPKMSVTEIAEESGFSSRSAFYRNFKDMTGLSPAEWKRAARESRP